MNCSHKTKRAMTLLEVMIAIALIMLCLLPFMGSHSYLFRSEFRLSAELELDREVSLLEFEVLQAMYENQVTWSEFLEPAPQRISTPAAEALQFQGYRWFEVVKQKPAGSDPQVMLIHVRHSFGPETASPIEFLSNPQGSERLEYILPLVVHRGTVDLEADEEEVDPESIPDEERLQRLPTLPGLNRFRGINDGPS